MSDNFSQPPHNPFAAPKPSGPSPPNFGGRPPEYAQPGLGYVRQIPILAVMTIVQGALLSVAALVATGYAIFFAVMPQMVPPNERAGMQPEAEVTLFWISIGTFVVAAVFLAIAVLHIIAGIRNLKYRGRTLTITAWSLGLLTAITCYCGPTSVGLAIWGLIVFLNPAVASAFNMAESGMSTREIDNQFY